MASDTPAPIATPEEVAERKRYVAAEIIRRLEARNASLTAENADLRHDLNALDDGEAGLLSALRRATAENERLREALTLAESRLVALGDVSTEALLRARAALSTTEPDKET